MLVYSRDCLRHVQAPGHVESPHRLEAITRKLESLNLFDPKTPEPAARAMIERVHAKAYVDLVETMGDGYLDIDTAVRPETPEIARIAAGGVVEAALASVKGRRPAFALVRPPGHHAGPDYGGGFCYFNGVAVAAAVLRERLSRIAILDLDAHHGNGTRDIFATSKDVLYVSTHQSGIYPGTGPAGDVGEGPGEGYTVNIPFPARSGDASYELAFREVIEPVLRQFQPEAILVSLGADAHYKDPLTMLALSSPGYLTLAERTLDVARTLCKNRVAFALEGGYHPQALAEVVAGTVALFRGESVHLQFRDVADETARGKEAVDRVKRVLGPYWDL
ncbi:MAG: histone deacetylase [Euryarchaeota archaeon]|nr:histone deacetylase [Euryarchaeota archaeon]